MDFDLFMNDVVNVAREDVRDAGYEELTTAESVEEAMKRDGSTLVMVNSTCGCAGGVARPAAANAIHYDRRPDNLVTVFAGQDREATDKAREYFEGYPPSSPSFAFMKDGELVTMLERSDIEGYSAMDVVGKLQRVFDDHCEDV